MKAAVAPPDQEEGNAPTPVRYWGSTGGAKLLLVTAPEGHPFCSTRRARRDHNELRAPDTIDLADCASWSSITDPLAAF